MTDTKPTKQREVLREMKHDLVTLLAQDLRRAVTEDDSLPSDKMKLAVTLLKEFGLLKDDETDHPQKSISEQARAAIAGTKLGPPPEPDVEDER